MSQECGLIYFIKWHSGLDSENLGQTVADVWLLEMLFGKYGQVTKSLEAAVPSHPCDVIHHIPVMMSTITGSSKD